MELIWARYLERMPTFAIPRVLASVALHLQSTLCPLELPLMPPDV
jgi:hypothetical protein